MRIATIVTLICCAISLQTVAQGAEIHGTVWSDLNGDGVFDAGESGLAGVTVFLDDNLNGTFDVSESGIATDGNGTYSFLALSKGDYSVTHDLQNGWRQTHPATTSHAVRLNPNTTVTGIDFGTQELGQIHGTSWHDLDRDGVRDANEPGLSGWIIYLDDNDNGVLDGGELSLTTNASGDYTIPDLIPNATYTVATVLQTDWQQTHPIAGAYSIALVPGQIVTGIDFSSVELPGEIRGSMWHDFNADGIRDAGEPGLEGWTIFLDTNADGALDAGEQSTTTDANGIYSFTGLDVGDYYVDEVSQPGWPQTLPGGNGRYLVAVGANQIVSGIDFANVRVPGEIHGSVWHDLNDDGVRDAGEPVLEAWIVFLDTDDNGLLDAGEQSTVTDANGGYSFVDLVPGDYIIARLLPSQWVGTYPGLSDGIERIVAWDDSSPGSNSSQADISADGRYVAFMSRASNLVATDTNDRDIFVFDRVASTIEMVSVATDGTQADEDCYEPSISGDGRYIAFHSIASNLVAGDTNEERDVFVHDRQTGLTERVSVASDGTQADYYCQYASISDDGRFVAFDSGASNLVADKTNTIRDIFVHDRQSGITERVSLAWDGSQSNYASFAASISADGRFVTYASQATNLVPGSDTTNHDVFIYDRQSGNVERVTTGWHSYSSNDDSHLPSISGDGRYVVFSSKASDLILGDTNDKEDIFCYDRQTGLLEIISLAPDGSQTSGYNYQASISANGRFVAFVSTASNLDGETNNLKNIFVYDRQTQDMRCLSKAYDGSDASSNSLLPSISGSGRYVAFESGAQNLVLDESGGKWDIFITASSLGAHLVSLTVGQIVTDVDFGNMLPAEIHGSVWHDLNTDGVRDPGEGGLEGWTVYLDENDNGVHDTNELSMVTGSTGEYSFINLFAGDYKVAQIAQTGWAQTAPAGGQVHTLTLAPGDVITGNDFGNHPLPGEIHGSKWHDFNGNGVRDVNEPGLEGWTIYIDDNENGVLDAGEQFTVADANGDYLFTNLDPLTTYTIGEVMQPGWQQSLPAIGIGPLERVSVAPDGSQGDGHSYLNSLSADGRYIVFNSQARNLAPGDIGYDSDIFVYDRQEGLIECVSIAPDGSFGNGDSYGGQISPDGRYVVFSSRASNLVAGDTNGEGDIFWHDRNTGITDRITMAFDGSQTNRESSGPVVSADGRYVAFYSMASNLVEGDTTGYQDIFLHDRQSSTTVCLSVAPDGSPSNYSSFECSISADGRYVAFASLASNLVPGNTIGDYNVYLYDRQTHQLQLVSSRMDSDYTGNASSRAPSISSDGRYVAFESWADDLVPGEGTSGRDIFVYDRLADRIEQISPNSYSVSGGGSQIVMSPTISDDGRYVAFMTDRWNGDRYVVVHDRLLRQTRTIVGEKKSYNPIISDDGKTVAFWSSEYGIVPGSGNGESHVYVGSVVPQVHSVTVDPGEVVTGIDFGNFQPAEISGSAWHDVNEDGVHDANEPGLEGWLISFLDGGIPRTATTDANGEYSFTDVIPGDCILSETLPPDWTQTYPTGDGTHLVTLTAGQSVADIDFGNIELPGDIHGTVWDDLNSDGIQNLGEVGLEGWIVFIDENGNGLKDASEINTLTDANGDYSFLDLSVGDHTVAIVSDSNWSQTYPAGPHVVTIDPNGVVNDVDFGKVVDDPAAVVQMQKLLASDGATDDEWGTGVVFSGEFAFVSSTEIGAVYIFRDSGSGYEEIGYLFAPGTLPSSYRGIPLATDGDTLVVGAPAAISTIGAVYVYDRNEGGVDNWGQVATLHAPGGEILDSFGTAVDIDGDRIIAGAPFDDTPLGAGGGAVHIFDRNEGGSNNWGHVARLEASDGGAYHYFGKAVAISGDTALIGAPDHDEYGSDAGRAYIFSNGPGGWVETAQLSGYTTNSYDHFGTSLDIEGDVSIVGAPGDTSGGRSFVFVYDGTGWEIEKVLYGTGDNFGSPVKMSGNKVAIADVWDDDNGTNSGSVTIHADTEYGWIKLTEITPADGAAGDYFGDGLWLSGNKLMVGAKMDNDNGTDSGSVYVFDIPEAPGRISGNVWEDLNSDGLLDVNEPGLESWKVYLDLNGNGQCDPDEPDDLTDSTGFYRLYSLQPDTYTVAFEMPAGWLQTFPSASVGGVHEVTLGEGQNITSINFGSFPPFGEIHGSKWNDLNGDGIRDAGEPGLEGWVIYIEENDNGQLDPNEISTVTDANGDYSFIGLSRGSYTVVELPQSGWTHTSPAVMGIGQLLESYPEPIGGGYYGFNMVQAGDDILISGGGWNDGSGHAVLYDGTTGDVLQYFAPSSHDFSYGAAIAAAGNNIFISSTDYYPNGGKVYKYDATTGGLLGMFSDPHPTTRDAFGAVMFAIGDDLFVTDPGDNFGTGAAYLLDGATGSVIRTFYDPTQASYDNFGTDAVPLGDNVLISSPGEKALFGAVYLMDPATGDILQTFANPIAGTDFFGNKIAAAGDYLLVSGASIPGSNYAGLVHLFEISTGLLVHSFPRTIGEYGSVGNMAVGSDRVFIGSNIRANGETSGVVQVYDLTTHELVQTLTSPNGPGDWFGEAIEVIGTRLFVSADYEYYDEGESLGSVFAFDLTSGPICHAVIVEAGQVVTGIDFGNTQEASGLAGDLNGDGKCDLTDLNMVLIDWGRSGVAISDPRSDSNGDGVVDVVDLNTVLIDWGSEVLAGDLNGDNVVDIVDLNMVLIDWGKSVGELTDPRADANGDGTVDIVDLNTVLIDWGKTGFQP